MTRSEAEEALARARAEAEQLKTDSEEQAAAVIAAAEDKAAALTVDSGQGESPAADDGDELAAMLAAAEQELAISEELRRQRAELDMREQELAERERALAARLHGDVVVSHDIASAGDILDALLPDEPEQAASLDDDEDEDPAERLSSLLEAAISATEPTATADDIEQDVIPQPIYPSQPPELPTAETESAPAEPRSRMAWPAPNRLAETEQREKEAEGEAEQPDEGDDERQSRYRSRSAQLPHLGNQAKSNMTTMANLRKKSRGSNG
jgi:hypothetical protein